MFDDADHAVKQTCFTWAWYEGVVFPTIVLFGRYNSRYNMQKLVCTQSIVWTEAYKHFWDICM